MTEKSSAAVAELKTQLSRYLSRVKAGQEILVTERGIPIARLVPVQRIDAGLESLRDLERQGLIRLGTGTLPKGLWGKGRVRDPDASVRKALEEERGSGW